MKLGDPMDEDTDIGGIIDEKNTLRLKTRIDNAVQSGAKCLIGNTMQGTLIQPTVLVNVPNSSELAQEEAF